METIVPAVHLVPVPPSELTTMNLGALAASRAERNVRNRLKGPMALTPNARRRSAGVASLAGTYGGLIPALAMSTSMRKFWWAGEERAAWRVVQRASEAGMLPFRSGRVRRRMRVLGCVDVRLEREVVNAGVSCRTQAIMMVLGRRARWVRSVQPMPVIG